MRKLVSVLLLMSMFVMTGCKGTETENYEIKTYTRDTSSGTREAFFKGIGFEEAVEDNSVLVDGFIEVTGNGDMINKLKADKYGIGYISLSSLETADLKGLSFNGVEASIANVLNDSYGLKRPFNYITRAEYANETVEDIVKAYVAYMTTAEGLAVIADKGGIVDLSAGAKSWDEVKGNYAVCSQDNSSVTVRFGGSTSVEKISMALSADFSTKCGGFIPEHDHTGSSDGFKRTQGANKDAAEAIDIGFASRGFKDSEVGAPGTQGQICWDSVVIVVNKTNDTLTDITDVQTRDIYSGNITTWNQLTQ